MVFGKCVVFGNSMDPFFYNAVMRKPIKIELTLINVYIVIHGLTLLWIFLIRLALHISIPVSFEVLKPSLNQISHSIH